MKILISGNTLLSEIQSAFHNHFSMLGLAFFKRNHALGQANAKSDTLNNALSVSETSGLDLSITIVFTADMTVGAFEQYMEETLNLHTQVFRKSGDLCLQTTQSDTKTLQEVQDEMVAADSYRADDQEPIDIHEQE
jgi:hypothetical protein